MKIYQPGTVGRRTVFAQPGRQHKASHFLDANRNPIMFQVTFVNGEADVEERLGEYLIAEGIAKRSPIILPEGASQ